MWMLTLLSLNKHAAHCEYTCANRGLYFGVMVQSVCASVRISEPFGMAPFSLSFLCLLLLDFQLDYGGIVCLIFIDYNCLSCEGGGLFFYLYTQYSASQSTALHVRCCGRRDKDGHLNSFCVTIFLF